MKKIFVLSILISFAMVSSCQKQSSTAEQQLAQRKAELDAREKALDEREKASDEREKALAEKEKATASARTILPNLQSPGQVRDPAQVKAERERRLQQLPPDLQGLIADPSQGREQDPRMQERLAQRERRMEELQRARMAHAAKPFGTEATSPTPSPAIEATSPSPSPTPE